MWIRGILLILFALTIDALQAIMAWIFLAAGSALQAITPVGGAAAGAVAGASYCWNSAGGIISGAADAAKCFVAGGVFGATASAFGAPLGIGLGFAIDIAISLTMGAGLILALILSGMYKPMSFGAAFVGEALPGLDVLPGWTLLVVRCIMKKNAEETIGVAGLASKIGSAVLSPSSPTSGLGSIARGISITKDATGEMARSSPLVNKIYGSEPVQKIAGERVQLASDVGKEISSRSLHAKTA